MAKMKSKERRLRLFNQGALALSTLFPEEEGVYLCPLCLGEFDESAITYDLTIEHVPTESYGGKGLALTCRTCNSSAGSGMDSHFSTRQEMKAYVHDGDPIRSTMVRNGVKVNIIAERKGDIEWIHVSKKNNSPAAFVEFCSGFAAEPNAWPLTQTFPQHHHNQEMVRASLMRSAYLTGFAYFGYRYILTPTLNAIRERLLAPEGEAFPQVRLNGKIGAVERDRRKRFLLELQDPDDRGTHGVVLGSYFVYLPDPGAPDIGPYDQAHRGDEAAGMGTATPFNGAHYEFPRYPLYRADLP